MGDNAHPHHDQDQNDRGTEANQEYPNSTVISAFAMLILGVLGILFNKNHPELVGGTADPEDGKAVAATAGMAIAIYAVGLLPSSSAQSE